MHRERDVSSCYIGRSMNCSETLSVHAEIPKRLVTIVT